MKWEVEYKRVEVVVIEADTEDAAIELARALNRESFETVESDWIAYPATPQ